MSPDEELVTLLLLASPPFQGLALAAKAAGNKEEALNNMKYIKVISALRATPILGNDNGKPIL